MKNVKEYIEGLNESSDEFAGWIAIDHKGTKLEIDKSEAKDLFGAKQIAIKKLKVPKSKLGLLSISPAVNESKEDINEGKEDKLMKDFVDMDIENVGNEEENIISFIEDGGDSKKLYKALKKISRSDNMFPQEFGEYNSALAILLGSIDESLNEARKPNAESKKFFKGMTKVKLDKKFANAWMPGHTVLFLDTESGTYHMIDSEGDHMEVKNIETLKQLKKSLNESKDDMYYKEISSLTGVRTKAIEKFVIDNKLDAMELMQNIGQSKIDRKDLTTAITGTPNNKYAKEIISKMSEQVNEGRTVETKQILKSILLHYIDEEKEVEAAISEIVKKRILIN
tara:strand:+ start:5866 stop:6882 length:1017 start_codon:yes stop_codon:yes gene_type:complete